MKKPVHYFEMDGHQSMPAGPKKQAQPMRPDGRPIAVRRPAKKRKR